MQGAIAQCHQHQRQLELQQARQPPGQEQHQQQQAKEVGLLLVAMLVLMQAAVLLAEHGIRVAYLYLNHMQEELPRCAACLFVLLCAS